MGARTAQRAGLWHERYRHSRLLGASRILAAFALALLACCLGHGAFVLATAKDRKAIGSNNGARADSSVALRAKKEPWNALVFKMPRPKPPREIKSEDDEYTAKMRKRLDELKANGLKPDKSPSEQREVREDKINDLIAKQAEEAQMDMRYALWRMDRENDLARTEEENPDLEVMRKRFKKQWAKLDGAQEPQQAAPEEPAQESGGFVNVARAQDIDDLYASYQATASKRQDELRSRTSAAETDPAALAAEEEERRSNIAYLQSLQQASKREDRVSRRVQRSPEDRRQEYEASKTVMFAATAGSGVLGAAVSSVLYGSNVAFSFVLGVAAAIQYLSGLAAYADNAESPMGGALGGRRFLAPILLVLLVETWPKLEANYPVIESLHLEPSLPAAILGFFTYNIGKVASRAFPKGLGGSSES